MKKDQIALYVFSMLIVAAFFAVIYLLIFNASPEGNRDLLNILLGALMAAFTGVVQYFFGSSVGSAKKTEIMSNK